MNHKFNLSEWMTKIPWDTFSSDDSYSAPPITSPLDICAIMHFRSLLQDQYDWGQGKPMDIFIWGKGDTENRTATKIGGLPYLPERHLWPLDVNGQSLPFIGQFNFTDSRDIVEAPGDILLLFGIIYQGEIRQIHMEWKNITSQTLISLSDIPELSWRPDPFHGYILRINNYPDASLKNGMRYPKINGKDVDGHYRITTCEATCIGKYPHYIQRSDKCNPGVPFCMFASIDISFHEKKHPWVNVETPASLDEEFEKFTDWKDFYPRSQFMIGDGGALVIRMLSEGALFASTSTY